MDVPVSERVTVLEVGEVGARIPKSRFAVDSSVVSVRSACSGTKNISDGIGEVSF